MIDKLSWIAVYPEIVLLVMACVILLVDLGVKSARRNVTYVLTLLTLALVAFLSALYADAGTTVYGFGNMVVSDPMGNWLKCFAAVAVMVTLVYGRPYAADRDMLRGGEMFTLSLFALLGMFTLWGDQEVELRFQGAASFRDLLKSQTPSSRRDVEQLWWELRMAELRIMNRPDEFELTALDFCVTYEVSPPSWEDPRCTCKSMNPGGEERDEQTTIVSSLGGLSTAADSMGLTDFRATGLDSVMQPPVTVELSGSIAGDVSVTLAKLDQKFAQADILSISCAKLVRVDFAAAGALLNWVSSQHSQGRQVQFGGVHRLIAGFFNVIGISELARISVRND